MGLWQYSQMISHPTLERCKIGSKLELIVEVSYMSFRLVTKSVTLDDLEQRYNHSQVAAVHPFGLS